MIRGRSATLAALESLSLDLRALQQKVAGLEAIRTTCVAISVGWAAQLDEFDSIRAAVAAATDDLVARVEAVDARAFGSS